MTARTIDRLSHDLREAFPDMRGFSHRNAARCAGRQVRWCCSTGRKAILARQEREGWGAGTIDRLSHDLREAFPDMRGFSPRNLKYMRAFAAAWPEREIVQEVLGSPGTSNLALLHKLDLPETRIWYARKATRGRAGAGRYSNYRSAHACTSARAAPSPTSPDAAAVRLRSGHAGVQGPVPVRLPRHRRAAHGTGARAGSRGPHPALPAGDGGRLRLRRPAGAPRGRR